MSIANGEKLKTDASLVKLLTNLCMDIHIFPSTFFTNVKIRYLTRSFCFTIFFNVQKIFFVQI